MPSNSRPPGHQVLFTRFSRIFHVTYATALVALSVDAWLLAGQLGTHHLGVWTAQHAGDKTTAWQRLGELYAATCVHVHKQPGKEGKEPDTRRCATQQHAHIGGGGRCE